jgi:hypothetical protein
MGFTLLCCADPTKSGTSTGGGTGGSISGGAGGTSGAQPGCRTARPVHRTSAACRAVRLGKAARSSIRSVGTATFEATSAAGNLLGMIAT